MNDPVKLRKYVREVLALAPPKRRFTERMIFDGVQKLATDTLQVDEMRAAIEWNHSRNLVEYQWDEDENQNTWALTPAGRKKENGK